MFVSHLIDCSPIYILGSLSLLFLVKLYLHFEAEKTWDPSKFFHYSKNDLKMTMGKELRSLRKSQNLLTKAFLILILLLTFFLFLNHLRH